MPQAKTTSRARTAPYAKKPAKAKRPSAPIGVKAPFPQLVEPELALLVEEPPEGPQWIFEAKYDGYRILCYVDRGVVTLRSRNQLDWTHRFPEVAAAVGKLGVRQAILDGEVVALQPDGTSSFQALQVALTESQTKPLKYYAFDLLYLDGRDLRAASLTERRQKLQELIPRKQADPLRFSSELNGTGAEAFRQAADSHLEGIIAKRRDQPHSNGRHGNWLKIKCSQQDEFVIGGYTDSTSLRKALGAILIGYYDRGGKLIYSGKVGTGYSEQTLRELHQKLSARELKPNPFQNAGAMGSSRGIHWVKPELVAQVGYTSWTRDGRLRHPVFLGLREDKPARKIVRDQPAATPHDTPGVE